MYVRSLTLKNFRNFEEDRFEFGPQLNLICGPNARGKTTVLEAIHLLITGRSFRSAQLSELIRHHTSAFFIELSFVKHGVEQTLRMSYNGSEKKIFYNNTSCHSQSSLLGVLQGTVMTPDDASIIKGQPKLRRRFLDIQLAQSDPLYVHHLTRYQRAMRFRNILLRNRDANGIEVWEDELARGGSYIVAKRYQALADLQGESSAILSTISGNAETVQLIYRSQCPKEENDKKGYYANLFKKMRPREMQLGNTIIGPHRDDMQIFIGSKEARYFSSEGQQRSCVAALRLSEWELLRRYADEVPLMLLDDLGISLDGARRTRLFEYVGNLHQVFITTTEEPGSFGAGKGAFIIAL